MGVQIHQVRPLPQMDVQDADLNFDRWKIVHLRLECMNKHIERCQLISAALIIADVVVGLFTLFVTGTEATRLVMGFLATSLIIWYLPYANDYSDSAKALETTEFQEYIGSRNLNPTIDNIIDIYKLYKQNHSAVHI